MKAIVIEDYGGVEQLKEIDRPVPEPRAGRVLVEVYATSVNPFDAALRQGSMKEQMPLKFPFIPGLDVAGVIRKVGADVAEFQVGDAVYGRTRPGGACAEYAEVEADALTWKPQGMSFEEAAAIPTAALTAYYGLTLFGKVQAGEAVLVQGGAGGTGNFTVQLANLMGAKVAATCRGRDVELVRSLGADPVIDYEHEDFVQVLGRVDVVVNTAGAAAADRSLEVLGPGGRYVGYAGGPDPALAQSRGVEVIAVYKRGNEGDPEALAYLSKLYQHGQLRVIIGQTFPLTAAGVQAAHRLIKTRGHPAGKLVIKVK